MGVAPAGNPPGMDVAWGRTTRSKPIDLAPGGGRRHGAGLSMTTTVEDAFGSRQMVDGFILNNQLTDFSFDSVDASGPIANRVQPGKRPRSAMSPTIVFDKDGQAGAGGRLARRPAIINYVAKVLVGTLDWGLNVQQAISAAQLRQPQRPDRTGSRALPAGPSSAEGARPHGAQLSSRTPACTASAHQRSTASRWWFGGADPRREGVAKGRLSERRRQIPGSGPPDLTPALARPKSASVLGLVPPDPKAVKWG
jgi:gamma-glutamyltranspeptidase/glutathione hydrolase